MQGQGPWSPGTDLYPHHHKGMGLTQTWVSRLSNLLFHGGKKKLVSDEGTQEGQKETRQTDTSRITGLKRQSKTGMCPPDFNYLAHDSIP